MRQIIFRGKRTDNNEWVYGYLYKVNNEFKIEDNYFSHYVDKETIGQFTGLTDKTGTKIFEGDIVHYRDFTSTWGFEVTGNVIYTHDCKFAIEYDDEYIKGRKTTRPLVCNEHPTFTSQKIEVIGNIYEVKE